MARKKIMVNGVIYGHKIQIPKDAVFDIFWALQNHKWDLDATLAEYKKNVDGTRDIQVLENEIQKYEYLVDCFVRMF